MRCLISLLCIAAFAADPPLRRAPGFSLPDLQLKQHDSQDYRGKLLVLDFIQTTCPHCKKFSAILNDVVAKYGDRVGVLTVVLPPDTQNTVQEYIVRNEIKFPLVFDCGQVAASYMQILPSNPKIAVPHAYIIDGNGMIRRDFTYGPDTEPIFEGKALFAELDKLL